MQVVTKQLLVQRPLLHALSQYSEQNSDTLARILAARNVLPDQLQCSLKALLAPNLLGLDTAVQLIDQAIDQQQHILIVGDYDVDGATSTALMLLALREMGAKVAYIVPDRFKYGYGLTPAIVDLAYQRYQPQLLITVDNGISSHAGVERCHALGVQVIITDHHLTSKTKPDAAAVVNPNQFGCPFPSKALAGVGVAFYLLAHLATQRKKLAKASSQLSQYLDLVALGTVADVAILDFNNRILVQAGLQRIRQGQCRMGILALLEIAAKNPAQLDAQDFGFVLGPRINAAGRMQSMEIGIECLLADKYQQAYQLAKQLDELNLQRRQVELSMREQAFDYLAQVQLQSTEIPPALILFEPEWHQGVIGIVAGRLKEHFHRPCIVFALDEDGVHLKGSARSIEGIHIRDSIESVAQQHPHLIKFFGGHAAAAGLTIEMQNFAEFKQRLIEVIAQNNPELFTAKLYTDGVLANEEFTLQFLQRIEQLGPWGHGFEYPVFEGIFEVHAWQWLKEIHLKLILKLPDGKLLEAIGFNFKDKIKESSASTVRMAYRLEKNHFRDQSRLQLRILYLESL